MFFSALCQRVRVDADLTVRDQRLLRLVHELHRIFHRHDVAGGRAIAMIDHRRKRRRFARARGADHQHEAALGHHDFLERVRQAELRHIRNFVGDRADHHAHVLLLLEHVHAKARHARHGHREVALQLFRNSSRWRMFMSALASSRVTSPFSFWLVRGFISPRIFMLGGKSLEMKRSGAAGLTHGGQQLDDDDSWPVLPSARPSSPAH